MGRNSRMESRLIRKIRRLLFNRRAVSVVISSVLLTATVMALGAVVLVWTNSRISIANTEYADLMDSSLARIKEKIVLEYVFFNSSQNELTVYLLNCGESDNVSIVNVYLSNDSWIQLFPDVELRFLNGTVTQSLDINEEGFFEISVSLLTDTSYSIRIVTGRGRLFDATFIA